MIQLSRYRALVVLLGTLLGACSSLGYYAGTAAGHLDLVARQQPITALIADPAVSDKLKQRLQLVLSIRRFAAQELALPDNDSYTEYADLERPFATWNVYAAPELSVEPHKWCFPIIGCVNYRGYFSKAKAQEFAEGLSQQGLDTFVAGSPAYSTLGWFADPMLNTMIWASDVGLAGMLFHELAHQIAYAKNDTTFNESFAMAVELEGARRWLQAQGREAEFVKYRALKRGEQKIIELIAKYRTRLDRAYRLNRDDDWKRIEKKRLIAKMSSDYQALRRQTRVPRYYDRWFEQDINNAQLVSVATYYGLVPAIEQMLAKLNGDLPEFYREAKRLAKLTPEERLSNLDGGLNATR